MDKQSADYRAMYNLLILPCKDPLFITSTCSCDYYHISKMPHTYARYICDLMTVKGNFIQDNTHAPSAKNPKHMSQAT